MRILYYLLFTALALAAWHAAARAQDWMSGSARAIDGDTLAFDSREEGSSTLRLAWIDAPENDQRCGPGEREPAEWSCGLTARLHLMRTLEGRGFLRCRQEGETPEGLRTVSCLISGGVNLNQEMVREGLALTLPGAGDSLLRAEQIARDERRGIWQGPFDPPWQWRADRGS